jgi:hypothetical protein
VSCPSSSGNDTYACRPDKGTHAAIARTQHIARRHRCFLKCDVRKFFAGVDHDILRTLLERIFKGRPLFDLLGRIIAHGPPGAQPGKGLPIGNLASQHFANLYLGELDHHLKERKRVKGYLRYMDDLLLFANDKARLHRLLAAIRRFLLERLNLFFKENTTLVAPVGEGIPFLGFRVYPGVRRAESAHPAPLPPAGARPRAMLRRRRNQRRGPRRFRRHPLCPRRPRRLQSEFTPKPESDEHPKSRFQQADR